MQLKVKLVGNVTAKFKSRWKNAKEWVQCCVGQQKLSIILISRALEFDIMDIMIETF